MLPQQDLERLATLLAQGRLQELGDAAHVLTREYPDDGRAWQFLGVSYLARNLDRQALPMLTRASELIAGDASVWDNLGLAYHRLKEFSQADTCFRRSSSIQWNQLGVWINWSANSLAAGNPVAAQQQAANALQLSPNSAAAWLNLGNALAELNRLDDAEQAFRNALGLQSGYGEAELSLGMLLDARGRPVDALKQFESALAHLPGDWRVYANLGKVYASLGDSLWATNCYRKALASNAAAVEVYSGLLFLRLYDETADHAAVFKDHRTYGRRLEQTSRPAWPRHANSKNANRRLKVGFVSGDLRAHPVAYFFEPFVEALNRTELEVFLYANNRVEDAVSDQLRRSADHWVQVAQLSDDQLMARILADQIDILVDLAGHSSYNRLPLFARKPAPVQVSWLGYPGTTGLTTVDYRPIYAIADPDRALASQFTERLVYLPCLPTFRHPLDAPEIAALPAQSRGYVTFGSFNRADKLGDKVIRIWSQILKQLPKARLFVGAVDSDAAARSLAQRFAGEGIAKDRVDLRPRLALKAYLDLHREIDILLDPFPFSGLTTSEHAVWMGVPVLTLAGQTLVSRQGLVVMGGLGLDEWVARDCGEYVSKAVRFSTDLARLADLRFGMRSRVLRSAHGGHSEARCMELAFRHMWQNWCEGRAPVSFEIPSSDGAITSGRA